MESQGLKEIYIGENEDFPSVIFILKSDYEITHDYEYKYWRKVRENVRKSGVEFVSNYIENDPLFSFDDGMTKI